MVLICYHGIGDDHMQNNSQFFSNKDCQFYPCHKNIEEINCLFCYCPLYSRSNCPGTPSMTTINGVPCKDCSKCSFPHNPNNYMEIIKILSSDYLSEQN